MSSSLPTRTLGPDGPEVGAVGLGCMGMTWAYSQVDRDDDRSVRVIHHAIDIGVTLIDTADVYGPFNNEELVGRALADRRDEVTLATKCGLQVDSIQPIKMSRNGRPEHVREAIEGSLQRLGVDYIDLYQLHRVDPNVPLEETWGAMAEVVNQGKARAIGMSEVTVEELETANAIHPVSTVQSELSLFERGPLDAVVPWCREHGVAFIPYSPLGRGFLTGQVTRETVEQGGDMRATNPRYSAESMETNFALVDRCREVAEGHGATSGQVALAWVLAQYDRAVPIPGTRREERLDENAGAAALELSDDDLAALDALPEAVGERFTV